MWWREDSCDLFEACFVQYVSVHESYFLLQPSVSVMSTMALWLLSFALDAVRVNFDKLGIFGTFILSLLSLLVFDS